MMENDVLSNFSHGIHIERGIINPAQVQKLRAAFFETLEFCKRIRVETNVETEMVNTVHHVLFLNEIFQEVLECKKNKEIITNFFGSDKFILNSIGGQNNTKVNYASNIHRDVRFYTTEKMLLNTIWCVSPININTGATEFMLNSQLVVNKPSEEEFRKNTVTLNAQPGDIVYFDSRIWHRAGNPVEGIAERIIYTPIFSRPYIKPGFDYAKACLLYGVDRVSENIKQLSSVYSDVPETHEEWYNWKVKKYYHKEQDL